MGDSSDKRTDDLLELLRELEMSMHKPEVRSDPTQLERLLHESFFEVGFSGKGFTRSEILKDLLSEQASAVVWSQDFLIERLADGIVLLRYRTARIDSDGQLSRHAQRTSIWQRTDNDWRIRFHQGTPTKKFARHAN